MILFVLLDLQISSSLFASNVQYFLILSSLFAIHKPRYLNLSTCFIFVPSDDKILSIHDVGNLSCLTSTLSDSLHQGCHRTCRNWIYGKTWKTLGMFLSLLDTQGKLLQSFVPPCLQSFVPPCLQSFVPPCLQSFVPPCLQSFVPPCLQSFVPPCLQSFVPPCLQSFVPPCLQSFVPPCL